MKSSNNEMSGNVQEDITVHISVMVVSLICHKKMSFNPLKRSNHVKVNDAEFSIYC